MKAMRCGVTWMACAAGALGAVWAAVEVHAQANAEPLIHACAADDGVLRLTPVGQACPAGQKSLLFKRAESDLDPPKGDEPASKKAEACPAVDKDMVAELENRLKALENSGRDTTGPSRVVAPFEVVDKAGQTVFQVAEDGDSRFVLAYNRAGMPVAGLRARSSGGLLWAEAATHDRRVLVGAGNTIAGLDIEEGDTDSGKNRVKLGLDVKNKTYGLHVFGADGKQLARIGETIAGGGMAEIDGADGKPRVSMIPTTEVSRAGVYVNGSDGQLVAALIDHERGGKLQLLSGGEVMVEAGTAKEATYGVVRAGPESFKPGVGILGLPGSYIAGKPN